MNLWRMLNTIFGFLPTLVAKLDRIESDLTDIRAEQDRQAKIQQQILLAVQPPSAVQLKLTLGKPISQ